MLDLMIEGHRSRFERSVYDCVFRGYDSEEPERLRRVLDRLMDAQEEVPSIPPVDLDHKYDDPAWEIRTDTMGYYRLEYDESDFEDLPDEKPETYIEVLDEEGKQLYTSTKSFFYKADEVEVIDASVDVSILPRSQALSEMVNRTIEDQIANLEIRKRVLDSRASLRSADVPQE